MNTLFLAGLTLFLAQALAGRDNDPARLIGAMAVIALSAGLLLSLASW